MSEINQDRVEEVVEDLNSRADTRPYHISYDTGEIRLWVIDPSESNDDDNDPKEAI